jgi:hypothetical protein
VNEHFGPGTPSYNVGRRPLSRPHISEILLLKMVVVAASLCSAITGMILLGVTA